MKYLKRIELINFQSHKYTDLYFDDRVNVIIGPSDSGKTAIIRAIKWVLFNEPSGTDFIRKGTTESNVILYFDDNLIIKRGRSKSKNYYEITYPNGVEERFEGFGTKVPEEIVELTGIKKVELDGNNLISLNISDQLESPFLLTSTPSIKAIAIGKLAGVENIDLALNKLSRDINEINSEKKSLEKELKFQKSMLSNYDFLEDEEKEIIYIEKLLAKIENKNIFNNNLKSKYINFKNLNTNINNTLSYINRFDKIDLITDLTDKLSIYAIRLSKLKNISEKLNNINIQINSEKNIIDKTSKIDRLIYIYTKLQANILRFNQLDLIQSKLLPVDINITRLLKVLNKLDIIPLENNYKKLDKLLYRYNLINNLFIKNNEILTRINNGKKYMKQFSYISNLEDDFKIMNSKVNKLEILKNILKSLKIINGNIKLYEDEMNKLIDENNKTVINYTDLLQKASICPFCFNELDKEHIDKIIEEYEV